MVALALGVLVMVSVGDVKPALPLPPDVLPGLFLRRWFGHQLTQDLLNSPSQPLLCCIVTLQGGVHLLLPEVRCVTGLKQVDHLLNVD